MAAASGLFSFYVFHGHMPARALAHAARDASRRARIALGLKKAPPAAKPRTSEKIPTVKWSELCRASGVVFHESDKADGNVNLAELAVLNALCRACRPRELFEIGTFDGRTTLNLAANSEANVFTLDLPAGHATKFEVVGGDNKYVNKPASGARFTSEPNCRLPAAQRITQLYGDSASFDFSPWHGRMDFVFVDGAHSHDFVMNDSRVALKLLRSGGGVIVWHDYGVWPDVAVALEDLLKEQPALPLRHVRGTSLVVARIGAGGR
ncbi:MAG: class I SAM-dependent methyltransferase [Verrucomicrobia bacterium]|nr:class I SAM-dependent methyltransferase [Verrucomicrobiota bacterium]